MPRFIAATSHCAWLVKLQPESTQYRETFSKAHAKMREQCGRINPSVAPVVKEVLETLAK